MPYIEQSSRRYIAEGDGPANAGELNYAITLAIMRYYYRQDPKYQHINDILGALEGAKLEFNRRIVAPFEETKRVNNGDVYAKMD